MSTTHSTTGLRNFCSAILRPTFFPKSNAGSNASAFWLFTFLRRGLAASRCCESRVESRVEPSCNRQLIVLHILQFELVFILQ